MTRIEQEDNEKKGDLLFIMKMNLLEKSPILGQETLNSLLTILVLKKSLKAKDWANNLL